MASGKRKERKPFHEEFADKIIAMLKEGTAPWQQPWEKPRQSMAPRNPLSGVTYRGGNRVWLAMSAMANGYDDPRWMTLKQANDAGYRVKKGEHGELVTYWQFTRQEDRLDDEGKPVLDADGKPEKLEVLLDRPMVRTAVVFNAKQIENFPPLPDIDRKYEWEPQEKAENILEKSGAVIKHDQRNQAYYIITKDEIHLPPKTSFDRSDKYYATALHELGHWTRHPSRLDRAKDPGSQESIAREELRAEISSWMLGQDIGIGHDPGQHAAYVDSWIKALRDDPMEILRACRDAEQIRDYVMGLELEREKTLEAPEQEKPMAEEKNLATEKTWLQVAYREKEEAKAHGARWDAAEKSWYAPAGTDLAPLGKFMARNRQPRTMPANPQQEFAEKLAALGLDLQGKLPELDGQLHRVPLLGKNGRGLDGSYCLYGNGRPAGWAQNHVTGVRENLVASGVTLSREERERQEAEMERRREAARHERSLQHDVNAARTQSLWDGFSQADAKSSPYLEQKGVEAFGIRQDQGNLIIPMRNVDGMFRGFQAIAPDGQKSFAKGIEKKGNFHLIGADSIGPEVLICEGYATGASLHMASGKPVAVAFDSGNLAPVAEAIRSRNPDTAITICADNDHALTRDGKPYNPGMEKAELAAAKVNGKVLSPVFTAKEKAQGLTDFNDLHKSRGIAAVKKQLGIRALKKGREIAA